MDCAFSEGLDEEREKRVQELRGGGEVLTVVGNGVVEAVDALAVQSLVEVAVARVDDVARLDLADLATTTRRLALLPLWLLVAVQRVASRNQFQRARRLRVLLARTDYARGAVGATDNARVALHIEELLVAEDGVGAALLRLLSHLTTQLHGEVVQLLLTLLVTLLRRSETLLELELGIRVHHQRLCKTQNALHLVLLRVGKAP